MTIKTQIEDLWSHLYWADERLFEALPSSGTSASEILNEFAHIIGAQETWLSRLQERSSRLEVWPDMIHSELKKRMVETHSAYKKYFVKLRKEDHCESRTYSNSSGKTFNIPVDDILMHVALHSQYHRGKVNLLLRQSGREPVPVDYIAYIRLVTVATNT